LSKDTLACGDLLAYRRYSYARAAAEEGDWRAAAEVLEQALERAPGWASAWFALGEAREKLGDRNGAAEAFRATLGADPSDAQGAAARLALLGVGETPMALPRAYVARLFDDYAPRFNAHVTEALAYCGPELIVEALEGVDGARRYARGLDLGCGAGLIGAALRARVDALAGVDLSPAMIAEAGAAGCYDALEADDLVDFLASRNHGEFDLVVAADVLVYFGDLADVVAAVARALAPGGRFAFTVETCEGETFRLGSAMRFAHPGAYVLETAAAKGLRPLALNEASTRREAGRPVAGLVGVFAGA
jgi:predicted TPR repeat methyltransferase